MLHDLGVDVGDAFARDCDTKAEKTAFLQAYAMAVYNMDVGGMKKVAVPSTHMSEPGRIPGRSFVICTCGVLVWTCMCVLRTMGCDA